MKIVITGAAGFIGSVLATRANELGHTVLALDDLSRGLNKIDYVRGVTFMRHDCRAGIGEAVQHARHALTPVPFDRVDAVVHLAAGTGSLDRPLEELLALNVEMTQRVYEDACALGAKVFLFPTTSLALAAQDSPYVVSKEMAFNWLKTQTRVPVIPLRFFNVCGAYKGMSEFRQHEVHLIPRLVECYVRKEALVINGNDYDETFDGTPGRDFVHVLDVAETILMLLARAATTQEAPRVQYDGAFWIGTGHVTSALQAHAVFQQFVGPVEVKYGPRRAYDTGSLQCPTRAIAEILRYRRALAPWWVSIRDEVLTLLPGDLRARL